MKKNSQFKLRKILYPQKIAQQITQVKQIKKRNKSSILSQTNQKQQFDKQYKLKLSKIVKKCQSQLQNRYEEFEGKQVNKKNMQNVGSKKELVINVLNQTSESKSINLKKHNQISKYKTPFNPFEQILIEESKNNSCMQKIGNNIFQSQFSNIQMRSPTFSDIFTSTKSQCEKTSQFKYFKADSTKQNKILIQNEEECNKQKYNKQKCNKQKYNKQKCNIQKQSLFLNRTFNNQKTEIWDKIKEFNFKIPQILLKKQEIYQNQIYLKEQPTNYCQKQRINLKKQLEQIYNGKFKLHRSNNINLNE